MNGNFRKKLMLYAVVGLGLMFAVNNVRISDENLSFLETSVVSIPRDNMVEPVDLSIEKVTLKKIADPREDFNFYKYAANIVITNHGGNLKNGQMVLSAGDAGKYVYLKTDEEGFSLTKDNSYIVENYEVLFDGNYNGGKLSVQIKLPEKVDYFSGNNQYDTEVFALPPKLEALGINEIQNDGTIKLDFDTSKYSTVANDFEIYESSSLDFDEDKSRYAEASADSEDKIYGYYRIKNSEDLMKNTHWSRIQSVDADPHFVKLSISPFDDNNAHYLYLRAVDPESGNFVVSNIIGLVPQKKLTRAAFARFFVEYSGVDVADEEKGYFTDVAEEDWYAPYVKTIYKLGLIKSDQFEFYPQEEMARGEALRVVMDYFDIDLADTGDKQPFADVREESYLYSYLKALFATGKAGIFGENFQPDQPATKNYLKHLIYEYKKNS